MPPSMSGEMKSAPGVITVAKTNMPKKKIIVPHRNRYGRRSRRGRPQERPECAPNGIPNRWGFHRRSAFSVVQFHVSRSFCTEILIADPSVATDFTVPCGLERGGNEN